MRLDKGFAKGICILYILLFQRFDEFEGAYDIYHTNDQVFDFYLMVMKVCVVFFLLHIEMRISATDYYISCLWVRQGI